jgi:hypothetical protein
VVDDDFWDLGSSSSSSSLFTKPSIAALIEAGISMSLDDPFSLSLIQNFDSNLFAGELQLFF